MPFNANNLHTQIYTSLIRLTNHVQEIIMTAKNDFDNFTCKNNTKNPEFCNKNIS